MKLLALVALPVAATALMMHSGTKAAPALTAGKMVNATSVPSYSAPLTIVHFWTFGCINCKHNLPTYNRWNEKFSSRGLKVIGVHTPETTAERSLANLKSEVLRQGIKYPVLQDNDSSNWTRWGVDAWPTFFLVDRKGQIRDSWVGEIGGTAEEAKWTAKIDGVLKESGR